MSVYDWFTFLVITMPVMFSITTGILLSWGVTILIVIRKTISTAEGQAIVKPTINQNGPRKSRIEDRINFVVVLCLTVFSLVNLIIAPVFWYIYLDVLFLFNVWITAYYLFLSATSLNHWPEMLYYRQLRTAERGQDEPFTLR
jgi:small-conductance mechanosensitive channel